MLEKLERHEPVIKLVFRLVVIVLLGVSAWRVEVAISTADAAHSVAYDARDYSRFAAKDADAAKDAAKSAADEAREAARWCRPRY